MKRDFSLTHGSNICKCQSNFIALAHNVPSTMLGCSTPQSYPCLRAVNYGLEKLNAEVAAWMRADKTPEGGKAAPPFLAMG